MLDGFRGAGSELFDSFLAGTFILESLVELPDIFYSKASVLDILQIYIYIGDCRERHTLQVRLEMRLGWPDIV